MRKEFGEVSGRVWVSKIARPEEEAPALFHYTDAAGLLGILKSRSLWATDFRSLNDASEMHYGMDLAHGLIKESAKRDPCERKAAFLARSKNAGRRDLNSMGPLNGASKSTVLVNSLLSY